MGSDHTQRFTTEIVRLRALGFQDVYHASYSTRANIQRGGMESLPSSFLNVASGVCCASLVGSKYCIFLINHPTDDHAGKAADGSSSSTARERGETRSTSTCFRVSSSIGRLVGWLNHVRSLVTRENCQIFCRVAALVAFATWIIFRAYDAVNRRGLVRMIASICLI